MINEYSKAIFEVATEDNQVEFLKESFDCFMDIYFKETDFKKILESPKIKNSDKKKIIDNSFKSLYSPFVNFIKVIIDNNRTTELALIYTDFVSLYKELHKIKVVEVISKEKMSTKELEKITSELGKLYTGYSIEIKNTIDDSLIGGYHVLADGKSLDLSIKNQIDNLKNSI